jgi:hypothetical protein
MSDLLPALRHRTFLRGIGLGIVAAPGFSLLSSCGSLLGRSPVIDLKGPRKVLSVDALEAAPDGVKREIYAYGGMRWTGFSGQAPSLTSEAGYRP